MTYPLEKVLSLHLLQKGREWKAQRQYEGSQEFFNPLYMLGTQLFYEISSKSHNKSGEAGVIPILQMR